MASGIGQGDIPAAILVHEEDLGGDLFPGQGIALLVVLPIFQFPHNSSEFNLHWLQSLLRVCDGPFSHAREGRMRTVRELLNICSIL